MKTQGLLTAQSIDLTLENLPALTELSLHVSSRSNIQLHQIPNLQAIRIAVEDDQCEFQLESLLAATALRHLELSGVAIQTLPDRFGDLESLESLDLSATRIRTLPECFGNLTNLEELHLGNDVSLPDSFANLTNLRKLVMIGQDGTEAQLDSRVSRLPALQELQVPNQTRLPIELGTISTLKKVTIGQGYYATDQASTIILDLCRQAMAKWKS